MKTDFSPMSVLYCHEQNEIVRLGQEIHDRYKLLVTGYRAILLCLLPLFKPLFCSSLLELQ